MIGMLELRESGKRVKLDVVWVHTEGTIVNVLKGNILRIVRAEKGNWEKSDTLRHCKFNYVQVS